MKTAIKVVGVSMCLVMLASCRFAPKQAVEETTQNNTTQVETTTIMNDKTEPQGGEEQPMVTLNTGQQVNIGDVIEVIQPFSHGDTVDVIQEFKEGQARCVYTGQVIAIYPETGMVWQIFQEDIVLEYNYRYVVDFHATEKKCYYSEAPQINAVDDEIRSVVRLGHEGIEEIAYLRHIETDWNRSSRTIVEMKEYTPLKLYDLNDSSTPQAVRDYYKENMIIM